MSYAAVLAAAAEHGMEVLGALHPARTPATGLSDGTLILLGAAPGFWEHLTTAPEWQDGAPDPIDRWSERVIGALAERFDATPYFPFGGPPYAPFVDWALASGRAFTSPLQMLVHDRQGLMISFRGALHFKQEFDTPSPDLRAAPCHRCPGRPCLSACPAGAFPEGGPYRLDACHAHLDSPEGAPCLTGGCLARRACPLSRAAQRPFAQNAHHMRYFHPT